MKLFVLPSVLLGILFLTSCTTTKKTEIIPPKTFQYGYQKPARVATSPSFSKQLTSGRTGSSIKVQLDNNQVTSARLGRKYFAASGHECRKYTISSSVDHVACHVNGKWYQASPIVHSKQN